ncbi:MAG TPA: ROK family protein [Anaeromyxobacter sp.]|nr:ROK family protein [Anaeromyxobacter sp.]
MAKRVLVMDVGGTNVKLHVTGHDETVKIPSGKKLTPARMMRDALRAIAERGWKFDAVTIGVPAPIAGGKVALEPANLGRGWTRFDFRKAARKPVRLVNDAAMQALGSYAGKGTMLFLGLGTGLGAALVADGTLVPLELARMPYKNGELEDYVGERALLRLGKASWRKTVDRVVREVSAAFVVDEVVLGGGNSRKLKQLPPNARLGANALAMVGGERLWEEEAHSGRSRFSAATGRRARGK